MPITYGTNDAFNDARDVVVTALESLMAAMVSGAIVPKFDAVYDTHWENPAFDFHCVSVSIAEVTHAQIAKDIEFLYRIELRILTGNDNQPFDEETFYDLANSVINWFMSHQSSLGSEYRFKPSIPIEIVPNVRFDDTRTVGGYVRFTIFGREAYTQL